MRALVVVLVALGCSGPPTSAVDAIDATPPVPDAGSPDALLDLAGPTVVVDDLHVAEFTEELHAFALLGAVVNPQLTMAVENGTLSLGLELRGDMAKAPELGLHTLVDSDGDPADNFDAAHPEVFTSAGMIAFTDVSIDGDDLHAEGAGQLDLGGLPLPLQDPSIDGTLVWSSDGTKLLRVADGRLRGAVPAQTVALIPNPTGGMCEGGTLLDVLVVGCGLFPLQPDRDLDGDGLETFHVEAGIITRCVDGDGTEVLGEGCASDARFADGYELVMVLSGVRALLLAE